MSENLIEILIKDRTTNQNLIYANNEHKDKQISIDNVHTIKSRIDKNKEQKLERTKNKAQVFTPSWVCNLQNNLVDDAWFGRDNVFNKPIESEKTWETNQQRITFTEEKTWQDYVNLRVMEITCGQAPYLVSRQDLVTGQDIPITSRIGLLDRKLRVIGQNVVTEKEWSKWSLIAFQQTYGYDYQGDNVYLARVNLLNTFIDYYLERFYREPSEEMLVKIAQIISWNIFQVDGLSFKIPYSETYSILKDWETNEVVTFKSLHKEID